MSRLSFDDDFFWTKSNPDDVAELVRALMAKERKDIPGIFLEQFAPWCGHCTRSIPEMNQATVTTGFVYKIPFVMMDGSADGQELMKYDSTKDMIPRGFPTIWMISNDGRKKSYEGERTAEAMQKTFLEWHPVARNFKISEAEILELIK